MSCYPFIAGEKAVVPIRLRCRVVGVSPAGYYAWARPRVSPRAQVDAELTAQIRVIHTRSRATYGVPRVHAELATAGTHVGRKRVARLMRAAGLHGGIRGRRGVRTTVTNPNHDIAPNVVFLEACTPGYYNREGRPNGELLRQNGNFGHGSMAYTTILADWRAAGDLAGLEIIRA